MTVARLTELEPWLAPYAQWLVNWAQMSGLRPRVTSVYRTQKQQAYLYQRWIRGQSNLPAAPPGYSWHQYRRAFDVVCDDPEALGAVWRSMGGSWWPSDGVHFQA